MYWSLRSRIPSARCCRCAIPMQFMSFWASRDVCDPSQKAHKDRKRAIVCSVFGNGPASVISLTAIYMQYVCKLSSCYHLPVLSTCTSHHHIGCIYIEITASVCSNHTRLPASCLSLHAVLYHEITSPPSGSSFSFFRAKKAHLDTVYTVDIESNKSASQFKEWRINHTKVKLSRKRLCVPPLTIFGPWHEMWEGCSKHTLTHRNIFGHELQKSQRNRKKIQRNEMCHAVVRKWSFLFSVVSQLLLTNPTGTNRWYQLAQQGFI